MKKFLVILLSVAMVLTVLTGCGSNNAGNESSTNSGANSSGTSSQATNSGSENTNSGSQETLDVTQYKGGDLVISTASAFNNFFTPYQAGNASVWGMFCMEPLGKKIVGTVDDYQLILAESIDIDEENFTMTIHLRQGVTFHSGDPCNAEDVAWTIQSWIDYGRGAQIGNPVSVTEVDEYTVEVKWDAFNVNYKTWILPTMIFSKQTFDKIGLDAMMTSFDGTGPYVMDEYVEDYSLSFTRNENYWQPHDYGPDTITFLYISDPTSMAASVMNGDVDYMPIDAPEIKELFINSGWELVPQYANAGNVSYLVPITNVEDDPWYNLKVREAVFTHGLDLNGIANAIVGDSGYHTDAIGYKDSTYYDEGLEFTSLDYDLAKQMLADAGYPDGFSTKIYTGSTGTVIATAVQGELEKIGITAKVETVEMTDLQKIWAGENTEGGLMVGALYFPDPILDRLNKFYGPYGSMSGATTWSQEEYDLYDKIATARTMEEQDQLIYDFCVEFVQKQFHFLPLASAVGSVAISEHMLMGEMAGYGLSYTDIMKIGYKE